MTTQEIIRAYLGARRDVHGVIHLVINLPKAWLTSDSCMRLLSGSARTSAAVTCLMCAARGRDHIEAWIDSRTESDEALWGLPPG